MATVSVRDVNTDLSELVDEVIKGGSVTITRDGKPVATLVAVESDETRHAVRLYRGYPLQ